MKIIKKYSIAIISLAILVSAAILLHGKKAEAPKTENAAQPVQSANSSQEPAQGTKTPEPGAEIAVVGPRGNVPADAPKDYGFWSFAISDPGKLSRSGQPTLKDFQWLKDNGWKSVVDLRIDGDHGEVSDDAQIPGFNALGFNYLKIQMVDGAAPTKQQARQFLDFVTTPENQPAHVHCRGGIGRAGIMVALYRYSVQGWPIDKILEESKLFQGGIDDAQKNFLNKWAQDHGPGSWSANRN